ncbi:MAG: prepilin-type N-terminal cleavage/methylation domain-containing protein [Planctomycetes bacterium]|nr:prepilin-type N-terminal cleavage/methylation domain-containing protein [Planctomycetota bacterium]
MRRRQGFTIVELLVAMALIVLIMSIISQAFVEGLGTFRQLKAIGDLQENLRTAVVPLREDLIAQHLVAGNGPVKLSQLGAPNNPVVTEGFFRIEQTKSSQPEGQDSDLVYSYFATDHALLFTINTGAGPSSRIRQFLSTSVPSGSPLESLSPPNYKQSGLFLSPWAEIAWFLSPMIDPATGGYVFAAGGSTQLFTLHRRVRLLVQDNTAINTTNRVSAQNNNIASYPEVSCEVDPNASNFLYFNNSKDVVPLPQPPPLPPPAPHRGGMRLDPVTQLYLIDRTPLSSGIDRVLADVISFQVQVLYANNYSFTDVGGTAYDTAITPAANLQIRALQITIRVWDAKTEQTRQITVIQDM